MKLEPFQAPRNNWPEASGQLHAADKIDSNMASGTSDAPQLTEDAIRLAIERAGRLRAKAFSDAFAAVGRLILKPVRLVSRIWLNHADERRILRELSALDYNLLRDIGIERADVRSVLRKGITARSGARQDWRTKGDVLPFENTTCATDRETPKTDPEIHNAERHYRRSA